MSDDKISDEGYVEVGPTSASPPHLKPVGAGALLLHAIQAGRHVTTAEIEFALAEERRAGRQWAIDQLRDELAYEEWRERDMAQPASATTFWPDYFHAPRFADYLEAMSSREAS